MWIGSLTEADSVSPLTQYLHFTGGHTTGCKVWTFLQPVVQLGAKCKRTLSDTQDSECHTFYIEQYSTAAGLISMCPPADAIDSELLSSVFCLQLFCEYLSCVGL